MSNQSIIEHKANMYYLEFREDYLQICNECTYIKPTKDGKKSKASPYCKALILAILEHWTNDKRSKGDGLYVYMSIPQWIASMYGMFGRNVIIDSLDELIGEGLIAKLPHKMYGRDTFKYLLNDREINRRIRLLPERKPTDIYPFTNQRDQFTNQRVASTNQLDTSLLVNDDQFTSKRNIESNRDTNIESTQIQESTRVASATSAHALSVTDTSHQGDNDEIPHADTSTAPTEPVVPSEMPQASAVGTHATSAVPAREPLRREQTPFPVTSPSDGAVGSAPQSSRPRASGRHGKSQQQDVTQALSLQGAQVKEWMEEIKGRKRRMTEKNIQAWNMLAEEDEISLENLREVIAKWEKNQWVKEHNYVIDEHVLTQDGGKFTFANGMELVRRERKSKEPPVTAGHTVSGYQYYVKPTSAKVVVV